MEEFNGTRSTVQKSRGKSVFAALLALLLLGGGGIAWKMRAERGAAGGGDPERDVMRAELARLTAAESLFVKKNGRYARTVSDLGTAYTSRVVVFASSTDGYLIRMSRPGTETLCEVSAGRFAAGHSGWQMVCGAPVAPGDRLVETPAAPSWTHRIRALLHEDCDSECRRAKLREGLKSPERKQLDQALE